MRKHLFAFLYGILLAGFTVYVALDAFVLVRVYDGASPSGVQSGAAILPTTAPAVITESSYQDANITITISQYREHRTAIYVADVQLSSPALLKTALADNAYGPGRHGESRRAYPGGSVRRCTAGRSGDAEWH